MRGAIGRADVTGRLRLRRAGSAGQIAVRHPAGTRQDRMEARWHRSSAFAEPALVEKRPAAQKRVEQIVRGVPAM